MGQGTDGSDTMLVKAKRAAFSLITLAGSQPVSSSGQLKTTASKHSMLTVITPSILVDGYPEPTDSGTESVGPELNLSCRESLMVVRGPFAHVAVHVVEAPSGRFFLSDGARVITEGPAPKDELWNEFSLQGIGGSSKIRNSLLINPPGVCTCIRCISSPGTGPS